MKLNLENVNNLQQALMVCRSVGIESVAISDGKFRGIDATKSICILSKLGFDIDTNITLGIGRITELSKRIELFKGDISIDTVLNARNEISQLNISAAKSKANYRCTSEKIMRYPKENEDPEVAIVKLTAEEVQSIAKAANAMGAGNVVVHCDKHGKISIDCTEDSTNDTFSFELENTADFVNDAQSFVLSFLTKNWIAATTNAIKTSETVDIMFGNISATLEINGHPIVMVSMLTGEDDDE